jgi:hypothetical protein
MANPTPTDKRKPPHVLFTMALQPDERDRLHRAALARRTTASALIREGLEAVGVPLAA